MMRTTTLTMVVLCLGLSAGNWGIALADDPKKHYKVPKPTPKKCYSGDQVRDSGKTATLENGKTYICDNGHWKEYLPLEPLAPTKAK
ncbi:MAG: exported protein of unknown function [Nitrospira sp.]|nr:MAG: exported protein of unknown function [Nitrospira sp.]